VRRIANGIGVKFVCRGRASPQERQEPGKAAMNLLAVDPV
jgi:hypothetical protein